MSADASAGPSLLLAQHETAHREHLHNHNRLHHRRSPQPHLQELTEIVQTIAVIQQIEVDSNGNTLAVHTIWVDSTGGVIPQPAAVTGASPSQQESPAPSASLAVPTSTATASPGGSAPSTPSNQVAPSGSTSTPSVSTVVPAHFITSNSTTLPLSTVSSAFANSSISSNSLTYVTSSGLTSCDDCSNTSFSSSYLVTSTDLPTSTAGGDSGGGTGAGSGSTPSDTAAAGNSTGSSSPPTPVVVGSVVGGIAGFAVVLLFLLFLVRWRKRHRSMLPLGSGSGDVAGAGDAGQSRSLAFGVPAALAGLTGRQSPQRPQMDRAMSSTAGAEPSFYRVSGRKLPSVLQAGGDGYGGGVGASNTFGDQSFHQDSQSFRGAPTTPNYPQSTQHDSDAPVLRPSPARTPVTSHGYFAMADPLDPPPQRPDGLGRSHPSQDGSHASRFTEEV